MPRSITELEVERECVIADLNLAISKTIVAIADKPEGLSPIEVVIALNMSVQKWSRVAHKRDLKDTEKERSGK